MKSSQSMLDPEQIAEDLDVSDVNKSAAQALSKECYTTHEALYESLVKVLPREHVKLFVYYALMQSGYYELPIAPEPEAISFYGQMLEKARDALKSHPGSRRKAISSR